MRRTVWWLFAVVVLGSSVYLGSSAYLADSTPTRAVPWGAAGTEIAFARWFEVYDDYGDSAGYVERIYVISSAGGRERLLFPPAGEQPEPAYWSYQPDWSPDGRRIAFVGTDGDLYTIGADGSWLRRLTRSAEYSGAHWGAPEWSPDGRWIATSGGRNGHDLIVINANGTIQRKLASMSGGVDVPAWSPDGRRIAFEGTSIDPHGSALYVLERKLTRLTPERWCGGPVSWSPDSRRIAFHSKWYVEVINADGTNRRRLVRGWIENNSAWSPDGQWIVFETAPLGLGHQQIHVIKADGSNRRTLTQGATDSGQPVWSPDGRKIAFVRAGDYRHVSELYTINADGTGLKKLTNGADIDNVAVLQWQPTPP